MPDPAVLAFDAAPGYRGECVAASERAFCDTSYQEAGEEDATLARAFTVASSAAYRMAATVRLTPGPRLDALVDAGAAVRADASSVYSADPRVRPQAAVDGDLHTTWQAAAGDSPPVLRLHLAHPANVVGVTLRTPATAPVATPERVRVIAGHQRWTGVVPSDGVIRFPAATQTSSVTITILAARPRSTTSSITAATRPLAAGISEVRVDTAGARLRPSAGGPIVIGCDAGLGVDVDGRWVAMWLVASRAAVLAGQPVVAAPCDPAPVRLGAGPHRIELVGGSVAAPVSLTFAKPEVSLADKRPVPGTQSVESWGKTSRRVRVDTSAPALLIVRENFNSGWRASIDGHRLAAARVDGWQQAFVVPGGSHGVVALTYAPQGPFTAGLIVGLVAAGLVVVLALVRSRRTKPGPVSARRFGSWTQLAGLAVAAGLLGGSYGLGVLAAALVALALLGRSARGVPLWVGAACLGVAGLSVARTGKYQVFNVANGSMAQLLCLAALVVSAVGGWADWRRQGRVP
jgi:arabinofuranan 3-O-arabinosyltransferase